MKPVHMLGLCALLAAPAYGQYAIPEPTPPAVGNYAPPPATNRIPILDTIPDRPVTNTPTAIIRPTNTVPRGAPRAGVRELDGSDMLQIGESGADHAADALGKGPPISGSGTLGTASRVVSRTLGALGGIATIDQVAASLYRASACERNGDQAGADNERAQARHDAMGIIRPIGLAQLCAKAIGMATVGRDVARDVIVSYIEGNIKLERELNARFEEQQNAIVNASARRSAMHDSVRQANEQSSAERAARAQSNSPNHDPFMTDMMLMLMPAAIAASQQRSIQPPLTAPRPPSDPCPPGRWQSWHDGKCYTGIYDGNPTPPSVPGGRSSPAQSAPLGSTFGSTPPPTQAPPKSGKKCSGFDRWWAEWCR